MILLSHPTVNAFVCALAEDLARRGELAAFHTTLAFGRRAVDVPPGKLRMHPLREAARLAAQRLGVEWLTRHETGWASVDAVYRDLDARVASALGGARAVYCYEDGALETFRAAQHRGLPRFYELPIAWWKTSQRLLREEAERLPEWAPTLVGPRDSEEKLARKSDEFALADLVVCPSRFVQDSLPAGTRSIVAEFGSPSVRKRPVHVNKKLRVLFAGAMTQRKGLGDLFAAFRLLHRDDVELVVMGAPVAPMDFYRPQFSGFIHEPPRPHDAVLDLMLRCDVLALPSIVEGRALVQQEALACGLPLLVTRNTGGGDLIEEGRTGFLVPMRDPAALAEKIAWFADHRENLSEMRAVAQRKAAEYPWSRYTETIINAIHERL
jgi:glycosyltransferase involved in cell wall biosynthesis